MGQGWQAAKFDKFFSGLCSIVLRHRSPKMATAPVPTTPTLSLGSIEPLYSSTPSIEGPSTSFHNEASDLELEKSREDTLEHESVETFMNSTCGCKLGPKSSPCCILLTRDAIERYRAKSLN